MEYSLILFIFSVIAITLTFIYLSKWFRLKGYEMDDIQNSLDISKLVLRFVKMSLSRRLKDTYKVMYHTDLIIEAIEYLQTLSADIPLDEKIDNAINQIYDISDKLYIKLTDDERVIVHEVLLTAYDVYVSLHREREEHRIKQM